MNYLLERRLEQLDNVVYRYVDIITHNIVYVGIVTNSTLPTRHKTHEKENWYKNGYYVCEYIEVDNKSEAEAIESHLINLYNTGKYFNKAKVGWGLNKYLPNEYDWKPLIPTIKDVIDEMKNAPIHLDTKGKRTIACVTVEKWAEELDYIDKITKFKEDKNER